MAATHKTLKMWINRRSRCVVYMIESGDSEGAGMIARLLARDAFKLDSSLGYITMQVNDKVKLNEYAVTNGIGKRFHGMVGTVVSIHEYLNNGAGVSTARVMFCEEGKDYGRTFEESKDCFEPIR